jgi:uncharacterized protein (TIGR03435 family)
MLAIQNPPRLEFEVASVRAANSATSIGGYCHGTDTREGTYPRLAVPVPLGHCTFNGVYLNSLVRQSFAAQLGPLPPGETVKGAPAWANTQRFDVSAKADVPSATSEGVLWAMMRTLLEDRFKLKFHYEWKEVTGYGLYVSPKGPRLQATTGEKTPRMYGAYSGSPDLSLSIGENVPLRSLAGSLTNMGIGGPVVDKTGLQGRYDFRLTFNRDIITTDKAGQGAPPVDPNRVSTGPSLFTAIEEQLGLRLVSEKMQGRYLVIDSVQMPSEN